MGTDYGQLSLRERSVIDHLHRDGRSLRRIAAILQRSPSTISRELRRNSVATKRWPGGYDPDRAHALARRRRRWDCRFKLARQPALRAVVHDRLAMGWSPEQIAGRLAREHGHTVISHESIYRFIYHRSAQKDYWHRLLGRAKSRRGRLGKRGGSPVNFITDRVGIADRPAAASTRAEAGHWEADLMLFKTYGQAILVTHERVSRFTRLVRQPSKAAKPVVRALTRQLKDLPEAMRRSVTFDNGTEFFLHHRLKARLGIQTYFCDTRSPWQKGGVENAIGRLRRPLPRKADLACISTAQLNRLTERYNQTPRKCLNFRTPQEVYEAEINRVALQP